MAIGLTSRPLRAVAVICALTAALTGSTPMTVGAAEPAPLAHVMPDRPESCLGVPVSSAVINLSSCWVTGPTSIVVAGTDARRASDGKVVIVEGQAKRTVTLSGAGRLRITSVVAGRACVTTAAGSEVSVDLLSARVQTSCAGAASSSGDPAPATTMATALTSAPQPSTSIYVFGSYIDLCHASDTTGCPLYNDGAGESVPSTGGMAILDFGAPCFDPTTLAWGTQMFNSQSCTQDSVIVTLAEAWIRGYETNPNRSSSPYIVAAGTSNSLTAAVPGFELTSTQMSQHGRAWFDAVVSPIATYAQGLASPVTVWSGSDIEQSRDQNWYEGARSRAWVDGYAAASGAVKPCVASSTGLTVDYGDYVPNEPGWAQADVYHIAYGAAPACPVPEIYYTANATEWQSLNTWAHSAGQPSMQFTGVLSENGAQGSLSASGSWNALQAATGQGAPYLSVIGSAGSPAAVAPDAPTAVTAVPGAASATIAWTDPAWDGGAKVIGYTVTALVGGSAVKTMTIGGWPAPATAVMTGLTNGTAYTFFVAATNSVGTGVHSSASAAVTPSELLPYTAVSTRQYSLAASNGVTWTDIDPQVLSLTVTPTVGAQAVITANADLWTGVTGLNQDLAIVVNGTVVVWKESGGAAVGSPNAATAIAVVPVTAGTPYTVKLQWKGNKASSATIYAGAGPIGGRFSPTRLSLQLVPAGTDVATTVIVTQPKLANSNGSTWVNVDPALTLSYITPGTGTLIVTGNSDLWTGTVGYNQDLGIAINGAIAAWKESGGRARVGSPNASLVQVAIPVTSGVRYALALQWKTNRSAPGVTIYAGAGPVSGAFSPTSLTVRFVPGALSVALSTTQYTLTSSDGATWVAMDGARLTLPATANCVVVLTANADLWTSTVGYNQDMAIAVTSLDAVAYPGGIVGWKESGGAAVGSPNAAFLQSVVGLPGGRTYSIALLWKANRPAGGVSIYSAAGGGPIFSPTSLTAESTCF